MSGKTAPIRRTTTKSRSCTAKRSPPIISAAMGIRANLDFYAAMADRLRTLLGTRYGRFSSLLLLGLRSKAQDGRPWAIRFAPVCFWPTFAQCRFRPGRRWVHVVPFQCQQGHAWAYGDAEMRAPAPLFCPTCGLRLYTESQLATMTVPIQPSCPIRPIRPLATQMYGESTVNPPTA